MTHNFSSTERSTIAQNQIFSNTSNWHLGILKLGSMSSPSHLGVPRQDDASWVVNNVPDIHVGEGHLCRLCIHSRVLSNVFNWMTRFYYNRKLGYLDKIRSKMERKQWYEDYGTVEELFSRKACLICALILQAIPTEIILLCASPPTTIVDSRT